MAGWRTGFALGVALAPVWGEHFKALQAATTETCWQTAIRRVCRDKKDDALLLGAVRKSCLSL